VSLGHGRTAAVSAARAGHIVAVCRADRATTIKPVSWGGRTVTMHEWCTMVSTVYDAVIYGPPRDVPHQPYNSSASLAILGEGDATHDILRPLERIRQRAVRLVHPPTQLPREANDSFPLISISIRMQLSLTLQHFTPQAPHINLEPVGRERGQLRRNVESG